jgi:hypothetical protein
MASKRCIFGFSVAFSLLAGLASCTRSAKGPASAAAERGFVTAPVVAGTPKSFAPPGLLAANAPTPMRSWTRETKDPPDGVLVVSRDIVQRCPAVLVDPANDGEGDGAREDRRAKAPRAQWLLVLDSLAGCLTNGEMRTERLRISGGATPAGVIRDLLGDRGVDRGRVDTAEGEATDDVADDCDEAGCTFFAVRIDRASHALFASELDL